MKRSPRQRHVRRFELPVVSPRAIAEVIVLTALIFCPLALATVPVWAIAGMLWLSGASALWLALSERRSSFPLPLAGTALLATALYVGLQCLPLPAFLLRLFSPQGAGVYAFSLQGLSAAQSLHPLTLDGPATGREFAKALAYGAVFFAAYQLADSRRSRRRLASTVVASALLVALIGYGHRLLGLGRLFGQPIYDAAAPRLVTTFGDSNNAAGLFVLGAPIALGLALRSRDGSKRVLWGLAYLLIGAAVFLTVSRGGIAAFVLGQIALGALLWRIRGSGDDAATAGLSRPHFRPITGVIALVSVLGISGYLAYQPIVERFSEFPSVREASHTGKFVGFVHSIGMVRDFPLTGIGRGAFPTVSARYLPFAQTAEYIENEPLQLAVDLGIPCGLGLLVILLIAVVSALRSALGSSLRSAEAAPVELGLMAGLFSLGIQNLADFSLELGGVALPATVTLALLLRPATRAAPEPRRWIPATLFAGCLALGLALATWALAASTPGWREETDAFARFAPFADGVQAEKAAEPVLVRHPASYVVPLAVADRYLHDRMPGAALSWANRAMYFKRDLAYGHLISATAFAELGRKDQALLEGRIYFQMSRGGIEALRSLARFYPAVDDLRAAVDETGSGLLALADFLRQRGRLGDGARIAELAVLASPDDAAVHDRAASDLAAAGQFEEAQLEAQHGIELAPDQPGGYLELSAARSAIGDGEGAKEALEQGLRGQPGQDDLVLALVRLHLAQGHPELAETSLKFLGPQVVGDRRAQIFALEGEIYAREGRTVKAEEAYRNAFRLTPAYAWNLVTLLESETKLTAAQEVLQELRVNAPESQRAAIDKRIGQEQARLEALQQKANAQAILGN